jgi:hypothetical protein
MIVVVAEVVRAHPKHQSAEKVWKLCTPEHTTAEVV